MKTLSILVFSASLLLSISILAADSVVDSAEKRSISEFVSPDGRIDIEAVRNSGYQGPLDLKGFDVGIDPRTGEPVVQARASSTTPADPDDIYWDNSISPSFPGVAGSDEVFGEGSTTSEGSVHGLVVYDSNLILAGNFTFAGSVTANNIVSWDGTSFSALGTGMNHSFGNPTTYVVALTVYNNQLIAGGRFDTAGSVSANYIASWDGTSWSALGTGMNSTVRALTVYNNQLIAGGGFTTAGGVSASRIASWDGSSWSALGDGMSSAFFPFISALTVYNNQLIAGGRFDTAGGVTVNHIASWDGSSWSALGAGMNSSVHALTVYDNQLIAGGNFTSAGSVSAGRIASWDGTSWSALGLGMDNTVLALTVYNNQLIAGGEISPAGGFSDNKIAAWDGTSWSTLGTGMIGGYERPLSIEALTVHDNQLIAGGYFTTAGSVPANNIASWDGSSWSALVTGMNSGVNAITVYDNQLIAGGWFTTAGGVSANFIASWDGTSWSALGTGMNSGVNALTVYNNQLIAGGYFSTAGGVSFTHYIATWDGTSWSALGTGISGTVSALTVYDNQLIAGGYFDTAGGVSANNIASWDGTSWSALGSGMNAVVLALTVYNNQLIAGGHFTTAGSVSANRIASWDGSSWSALGTGMSSTVYALTVYDNQLIAGGWFTTAGGVSASRIASWDGTSWSALGDGMSSVFGPPAVSALTVYYNQLIAGGNFATAGGVSANNIASWDGTSWSALGTGMNYVLSCGAGGCSVSSVAALTVYDLKLTVGGVFTVAGGKLSVYLAQWTKGVATDVEEIEYPALPDDYKLAQNYPNPFNPTTVIEFDLPRRSNVSITIFNLLGQKVKELMNEEIAAGSYRVSWDGLLSSGQRASSGIYFYRLIADDFINTKKMILLK